MPAGWELIATVGIVLVAGVVVGLAGFGFALFAVPPLLFFHEPSTVVFLVNLLGFSSGALVIWGEFHEIRKQTLRDLLPWALPGLFIGLGILKLVNGTYIRLWASIMVVIFATIAATRITIPGVHRPIATAIAGFSSGVLGTSAGLPGPPIALLFTARAMPPAAFRVTITAYFQVVDVVAVALVISSGLLIWNDIFLGLAMIPASLIGRWTGTLMAKRISPGAFRHVVIALLLLTGFTGAVGAIISLS